MNDAWIADRMKHIDASGIRKAFDMAKSMKDPINLSIGLPDFDVAEPVKAAAIEAIEGGHNAYTVTQGIPELRDKIQAAVDAEFGHADRQVLITSGTSGGAAAGALLAWSIPGDEVIIFDPYFVMYRNLATLAGGVLGPGRHLSRLPDRRRQGRRRDHRRGPSASSSTRRPIRPASSPRPTRCSALAELCRRAGHPLISDEVYRAFCYDQPVRHAGDLERRRAGRRRLQQVPRHDRLAARLRPRPEPLDPGDGQAPAVQLRLRPEHGPVRRRRRPRPGPDRPDRRLPPQARHGRRGA